MESVQWYRETVLRKEDFIYPIFVVEGENVRNPIASMPGCLSIIA